jgi:hypothetical protein
MPEDVLKKRIAALRASKKTNGDPDPKYKGGGGGGGGGVTLTDEEKKRRAWKASKHLREGPNKLSSSAFNDWWGNTMRNKGLSTSKPRNAFSPSSAWYSHFRSWDDTHTLADRYIRHALAPYYKTRSRSLTVYSRRSRSRSRSNSRSRRRSRASVRARSGRRRSRSPVASKKPLRRVRVTNDNIDGLIRRVENREIITLVHGYAGKTISAKTKAALTHTWTVLRYGTKFRIYTVHPMSKKLHFKSYNSFGTLHKALKTLMNRFCPRKACTKWSAASIATYKQHTGRAPVNREWKPVVKGDPLGNLVLYVVS